MIEVYGKTSTAFFCGAYHLLGSRELVGDRFLAQHVASGFEGLYYRPVMIAAVFEASGRDAANVRFKLAEHPSRVEIPRYTVPFPGLFGAGANDVAHADELGEVVFCVNIGVQVANWSEADNADSEHRLSTLSPEAYGLR